MTYLFLAVVCGLHSPSGTAATPRESASAVRRTHQTCEIARLPADSPDQGGRARPDYADPESGCDEEEKYAGSAHASPHATAAFVAIDAFQSTPERVSLHSNTPRLILSTQLRC